MLQYYTCVKVLKTMVFFKVAFHTCKYYSSLCGIIFIPQYPYMVLPWFFYLVLFSLYELSSLNHFIPWYRQSTYFLSYFHQILLVSIFSRSPAILESIAAWLLPSGILSGMSGTFSNHYRERK